MEEERKRRVTEDYRIAERREKMAGQTKITKDRGKRTDSQ